MTTLAKLPGLRDQPEDRQLAAAEWLRDLYPPQGRGYWGSLQPDRLGDHLVGWVAAERPGVFDGLPDGMPAAQANQFMEVLSRVSVRSPHAADLIKRLVSTRPDPLAKAAIVAATRSENPAPLISAIQPLTSALAEQPGLLGLLAALTQSSPLFGQWPGQAHRAVASTYRQRAHEDPVTYRPHLAWALYEHAKHLSNTRQSREAQAVAEEAIAIWRELGPGDDHRKGLAATLNMLAALQVTNKRPRDALPAALESTGIWEQLAGENSGTVDVMGLVDAFSMLGVIRNRLGQKEQSLKAAQRAVEVYRSAPDPDFILINAGMSASVNTANRLMDLGRTEEALAYHREAVSTRRRLTETYPYLFDGDLASSLHNLGKTLAQLGQAEEAYEKIDEALKIYHHLAALAPGTYGPKVLEAAMSRSLIADAHAVMAEHRAYQKQRAQKKKQERKKRKLKRSGKKRRK